MIAYMALIGLFAGGVKATIHRNEKTTLLDVIAAAFASAIAGGCVGSALLYVWPERDLVILPLSGVGGWIGVALLDWASGVAMRIAKQKVDDNTPPKGQ